MQQKQKVRNFQWAFLNRSCVDRLNKLTVMTTKICAFTCATFTPKFLRLPLSDIIDSDQGIVFC